MQTITQPQVTAVLRQLGLAAGDGLLVHSALQFLGRPAGGALIYLDALEEITGLGLAGSLPVGTLAVPAFNFGFARGEAYDPLTTPSQGMGTFSELVRQHPAARRTSHPLQSLAVIGRWAADMVARDTASAFDPGSAFERMLELDFKILLLGADVQAISLLHYSEQRLQVPYRYWKEFSGQVRTAAGWQPRTYRMFVRDLQLDPRLHLGPVQARLESLGQWRSAPLGYGQVAVCSMADFVRVTNEFLSSDPWSLVTNR